MFGKSTQRAALLASVATIAMGNTAGAAQFYFGGYDGTALVPQGTPDLPVSSPFVVAGQTTFYGDAAGTVLNSPGTGFVTATDTSAELFLGGSASATAYTASTPASTGTVAIHGITLQANNAGTNTLSLGFTSSGRYQFASGGTGTVNAVGITQNGSANWNFVNGGGSAAPFRAQNSFNISGSGSGNISIPFNIANGSGTPSLSVNLSGGAKLTLGARNDFSGSGGTPNFTLTRGTVDFLNSRSFGQFNVQIRLNGGTLLSSSGVSIDNGYVGTGGTAGESPIRIGGNVTFAGTTSWGTGNAGVTISGATRTITANNTGTTGTTIPGIISDNGGGFGLTVASTVVGGRLTLTGANTYTGRTTVQSGTLDVNAAASAPLLSGVGGADIQGGKVVVEYTPGNSQLATIKGLLTTSYNDLAGHFNGTTQIRSTTASAANRALGYSDSGTAVIVMYTAYGDANLDGSVDVNDLGLLATNYGSGTDWSQGDFNYDGAVDVNDLGVLATNYGDGVTPSVSFAQALAAVAAENPAFAAAIGSAVPEPTSLAVLGLGTLALHRRRRS